MRIHLINLDRSEDRLAEFRAANAHLTDVERFPAIDGTKIDATEFISAGVLTKEILEWYTPGVLGSALSHISLWDRAIATVTVCEDDAVLNLHFENVAPRVLEMLPADWDIVFWGHNCGAHLLVEPVTGAFQTIAISDREEMQKGLPAFQRRSFAAQPLRLVQMFGLVCYSISAKGAALLRRRCLPLREMQVYCRVLGRELPNLGLDHVTIAHYADLQAFVSFPPLALCPNDKSRSLLRSTRMIPTTEADQIKPMIEQRHGGIAIHARSVPVSGRLEDGTSFDAVVHVFDLHGFPSPARAYGWLAVGERPGTRRLFTALQVPPVTSPEIAVRLALKG